LVVVVSEETGIVSIAEGGRLETPIAVEHVAEKLRWYLQDREPDSGEPKSDGVAA
jgi:hypothetical protein